MLSLKQQHDLRNGIDCLHGFFLKLRKEKKITDQDCMLGLSYIKKMDGCLNDGPLLWKCISECCAKFKRRKRIQT